jgi:predicted enzyme related to lactoylglutathione lyase
MPDPVIFFEVLGRDGDALRQFYGDLFGWTVNKVPPPMDYGMVARDDAGIEGGIGTDPNGGAGHTIFYVYAGDPQATLDRGESLGGRTLVPPTQLPGGGVIAVLSDPEGHKVGLYKPARGS